MSGPKAHGHNISNLYPQVSVPITTEISDTPRCLFSPKAQSLGYVFPLQYIYPSTHNPLQVILGLMTFGPDEDAGARITSLDEYNKCLDYFQSQGYNEVDTARTYVAGKQEAFTTAAHWKERGLTLATKWYPNEPGFHKPAKVREMLTKSLAELKTDCVDIFYLHAADRSVPFTETLQEVNEMHKEGKFVQLGLSNFTAYEVAEVVITCKERGWVRPTIYQGMYNAISLSLFAAFLDLPLTYLCSTLFGDRDYRRLSSIRY